MIDPTIPAVVPGAGGTPPLASINVPGYHSVERFNFGTPNETALWFINGGFYQLGGHRHYDDGQVSIYAHSAPLAIDWNPNLYYPEVPGRVMHDSIVYDSELSPSLWSADQPSLSAVSTLFQNPTNTEFASFANSTTSTGTFTAADGTVWSRTVRTMNFDAGYPVIYVTDQFAGPSAGAGKTLTWNLMATGAVTTPAGSVTPVTRFSARLPVPCGRAALRRQRFRAEQRTAAIQLYRRRVAATCDQGDQLGSVYALERRDRAVPDRQLGSRLPIVDRSGRVSAG